MKLSVRNRIAKELWSLIPDKETFVVESDMIVKIPLVDVVRYLLVTTPTRPSQYEFDFYAEAMPLYFPGDSRYRLIAKRLNSKLAEHEVSKAIASVPTGLEFLDNVASAQDVLAIMNNPSRDTIPGLLDATVRDFMRVTSLGMIGDWDEAKRKLIEFTETHKPTVPWLAERLLHVQHLLQALEVGPKEAQAVLDSWILNRCTKLGFKQYLAEDVKKRLGSYA